MRLKLFSGKRRNGDSFSEDKTSEEMVSPDINMTPLIDIMLVLLIIFLATSSITLESGLDIEIPKTKFETQVQDPESIVISVNDKGVIYVQGKNYTLEEIEFVLSELLRDSQKKTIVLEGDQRIHLGLAIQIMDIARSAGAQNFAIAAQENL